MVNPYCKSGYQIRLAAEGTGREEYRAENLAFIYTEGWLFMSQTAGTER